METKSREEILKVNICFTQHLLSVQKSKYEPSNDWKAGDSVILDHSDSPSILTKGQAAQMNAEEQAYYLNNKDHFEINNLDQWIGRSAIVSSQESAGDYLNDLSQFLSEWSLKYGHLLVMGDWNTPWLSQKNDYPPVLKASEYLAGMIDETFNGGFKLSPNEISEFIPHLFWLTRCNASLPQFMMSFEMSQTVLTLCKYGVLHLEFYNVLERDEILKHMRDMNFREVDSCKDPVEFDPMDHRKIVISRQEK